VHLDLGDAKEEDHEDLMEQLDTLAKILDTTYKVPGTPFKLGLGTSLGRIPVAGECYLLLAVLWLLYLCASKRFLSTWAGWEHD
jgi:hypothetical protein